MRRLLKIVLGVAFLFTYPATSSAAIGFDTSSAGAFTNTSPLTWSHTSTGSSLVMLIGVGAESADDVTAVTYNGVAATQLIKFQLTSTNRRTYIYGLVNPATGSHTVSVSFSTSGAGNNHIGAAETLTGASQTGLPDASNSSSVASTASFTQAVTTVAADAWLTGFFIGGGTPFTGGTGTTIRQEPASDVWALGDSNGTFASPGSHSIGFNQTTSVAGGAVVSVAPATAAASTVGGTRFKLLGDW